MTVAAVPLGEVANFVRGITFKPGDVVDPGDDGSVVCLRTKNVQAEVDLGDLLAVPSQFVKRHDQYLQPGDVLISSANSWNLVGKCSWIPKLPWLASFGGFVTALRPKDNRVDRRYLYHWFIFGRTQQCLRSFGRKTTNISNLDLGQCRSMDFPLPPIEEQRRIAVVLDAADALRAKRRQALAKLDTLTQAIFIASFGDPLSNPMDWPVVPFESQIHDLRYGTGSPPPYVDAGGVPFVRATDIKCGRIRSQGMKHISGNDAKKLKKCELHTGDLIIVRSGVNTGDCAVVPSRLEGARAAYDIIVSLPYASSVFFHFLLDSAPGRNLVEPLTRRAAQPHLNAKQIRALKLIAPPETMREVFATHVESLTAERDRQLVAGRRLDDLFASLQQRAFRGVL